MPDKKIDNKITKRAIEESFPIVEINRLAEPERNSFKPIYQMHKWWARRASSVFRAILLGAMKPAGSDIMKEFYLDHSKDPDTNGVTVLDPFMGGGTTIVEALRLGAKAIGIDLNPVAWFIVKTEVEPVDINELKNAFERLANRKTLSGKPLKEELLSYYKTTCPCCKNEADSVYTFWVKSAICTNPNCKEQVPLFKNYIIAQKSPSIRYYKDCECKTCKTKFDWEIDAATLMPFSNRTTNGRKSGGEGRMYAHWAYAPEDGIPTCFKCGVEKQPITDGKKQRKKVPVHILLCPECYEVWQYRGELSEEVSCPTCRHTYDPLVGNIPNSGKFTCQACGTTDNIIHSIRRLPEEQLLPTRPYAIEAYCNHCVGVTTSKNDKQINMYTKTDHKTQDEELDHYCELNKNNGKFFKKFDEKDKKLWMEVETKWNSLKSQLPYPKSKVPYGEKTKSGLIAHHYIYWWQMFNSRQLLALSTLLKAIDEEPDQVLKEMLLSAFYSTLENNSTFSRYTISGGNKAQGLFSRHDYQPKLDYCENNVWGAKYGHSTFRSNKKNVIIGKEFGDRPFDRSYDKNKRVNNIENGDSVFKGSLQRTLLCKSSENLSDIENIDYVITDPPYAGNVNYSELGDYFYVWIREVLKSVYPHFAPEISPKDDEVIENKIRNKTSKDFEEGLTKVYKKCFTSLKDNGLMVFTFHHNDTSQWELLLRSIMNSGFYLEAVFPVCGEAQSSLHLMDTSSMSYDLIHVCKKRITGPNKARSWASVRKDIRQHARREIAKIEHGSYGKGMSPADTFLILIGRCLELYSKNYGNIVDYKNNLVSLHQALMDISEMVAGLMAKESPFPSELEDTIDAQSKVYIRYLAGNKEIQSDSVYKYTRGTVEVEDLMKAGLVVRGRAKRGRTFEIKGFSERYTDLLRSLAPDKLPVDDRQATLFPEVEIRPAKETDYFIDKIHFLTGLVANKENVYNWIQKWDIHMPQIRAALKYMIENGARDKDLLIKLNGLITEDLFISQHKE